MELVSVQLPECSYDLKNKTSYPPDVYSSLQGYFCLSENTEITRPGSYYLVVILKYV